MLNKQHKQTSNKNKQAAKQNKLNQNSQMWRYHLRREDVSLQLSRGSWETDCFYLLIFQLNNLRGRCVPTALPREEGHGLQDAQWHCQPLLWLHLPVKCGVRQKVRELFCSICELNSKTFKCWWKNIHTGIKFAPFEMPLFYALSCRFKVMFLSVLLLYILLFIFEAPALCNFIIL